MELEPPVVTEPEFVDFMVPDSSVPGSCITLAKYVRVQGERARVINSFFTQKNQKEGFAGSEELMGRETNRERERQEERYYLYIRDREDSLPATDPTFEPVAVDPSSQTQALTFDKSKK